MALQPRKALEKVRPAIHGGPDFAELKTKAIPTESLLDFSVGFNPLGAPPGLREKLASVAIDVYPDSGATEFRQALARKLKVEAENVIAGNGSSELMWLCALAYFDPGDRIVIAGPTFGEYKRACLIAGCIPFEANSQPPDFELEVNSIIELARKRHARAVFLCNPNNPTGKYLPRSGIENLLDNLPDSLLILDEAYVAFTDRAWRSEPLVERDNVVILRSMTKDYGLAGLRLGYALANREIIANLQKVCPPWNVNNLAQKAGVLALDEDGHVARGHEMVNRSRDYLFLHLRQSGLEPVVSRTNFFLVKVGDAAALRRALLAKGILVRDCASFGLPEYIRLAARALPDCERLVSMLSVFMQRLSTP